MKGLQGEIFWYILVVISNDCKSSLKVLKISSTVCTKIIACTFIIGRVALENKIEKPWHIWFLDKREVVFIPHLNEWKPNAWTEWSELFLSLSCNCYNSLRVGE